jgi:hypothetical protein
MEASLYYTLCCLWPQKVSRDFFLYLRYIRARWVAVNPATQEAEIENIETQG